MLPKGLMVDMDVQTPNSPYFRSLPPAARLARSTLAWALCAGIALLAVLLVLGTNGLGEFLQLRQQREALRNEHNSLLGETENLGAQLKALRCEHEPFALEKIAREQYNMRRPGEQMILLVPDPGGS
jgi:cell division protein FtsB